MVHKQYGVNREENRTDYGFTLLEITVTLTLFVLFSAITIPVGARIIA
jgi:prepilin-type N-terminal cleavage/methylation domain-containing protein